MPSFNKQPSETKTVSLSWTLRIPAGVTIVSATVYASDKLATLPTTALEQPSAILATSVSLVANPGVGALLTIDPGEPTEEVVKVSAISGSGPYAATIVPELLYAHADNADVEYEPGVSSLILVSTTATIAAETTVFRVRRGIAGHTYRISVIATLSTTDVEEGEVDCIVSEV